MNPVEEIKGLISELKESSVAKEVIEDMNEKLAKVEGKIEELEAKGQETVSFDDKKEAKAFLGWVSDLAEGKTLTEGVPADGGYLVPDQFRPELLRLIEEYGFARRYTTKIPMSGVSLTMPSLASGVTTYWVDEATAITESQPSFGQVTMTVKKLAALVPVSSELLADSSIAMANLIIQLIAEATAAEEDRVCFTGSTAATDPFDGILYTPGVANVSLDAGEVNFADLDADDFLTLTDAIPRSARRGAMFFLNREVLNVVKKLKDSTGNYIVQNPVGSAFGQIWGYPYVDLDVMPSLADSGADKPFLIFGNPRYMYMPDRQQINFARSVHYAFNMDVTYIRATERIGFKCGLPQAFAVLNTAAS
jgi:HK97 family phage major capsid protein